jgi:hypothetical protein
MKKLHQEFKNISNGATKPNEFRNKAEQLGFNPTENLLKSLNDPQPQFRAVVKNLGKFHKATNQEVIGANFIDNHKRYQKRPPAQGGYCKNEKLKALQDFQRGVITKSDLGSKLGPQLKEISKNLGEMNDGDFCKIGSKLVRSEQIRADALEGPQNLDPILNKPDLIQRTRFGKTLFSSIITQLTQIRKHPANNYKEASQPCSCREQKQDCLVGLQ